MEIVKIMSKFEKILMAFNLTLVAILVVVNIIDGHL